MDLDRDTLIKFLREGKKFKTGERIPYQGNDFRVHDEIQIIENDNDIKIIAGKASENQDSLENVPII